MLVGIVAAKSRLESDYPIVIFALNSPLREPKHNSRRGLRIQGKQAACRVEWGYWDLREDGEAASHKLGKLAVYVNDGARELRAETACIETLWPNADSDSRS